VSGSTDFVPIEVPRQGVNDDTVRVVEWLVADEQSVSAGDLVVVVETTKSAMDLEADVDGVVFHQAAVGTDVPVGSPVGIVSRTGQRPEGLGSSGGSRPTAGAAGENVITAKAQVLIDEHGIDPSVFADHAVVRASDVMAFIADQEAPAKQAHQRAFLDEVLDPDADWDAVLGTEEYRKLGELLTQLRRRMKARFDRHVPTGELLHDRWELAREYGFGEGSNVYDDCVIFGDVRVGANTWVGPHTILDGSGGGLVIGDYVDVGAGCHVYTHNTIERALTGHRAPIFTKPTRIGNSCFIGPQSIIAPGTVLGDHCFASPG
jgi:acetyltransferase-like isoleucine patch superfamily enzyme